MSEAIPGAAAPEALQFDYSEPIAGATPLACAGCSTPLRSVYHTANGKKICTSCRAGLESRPVQGGFMKALVFGLGAAVAGWIVYFLVLKVTGLELSLISILVGFIVGRAVMLGCGERGGKRYQALAMGLTYLSITWTYVPLIAAELGKRPGISRGAAVFAGLIFASAAPFLTATESPMGLLILGIGLYQAWKITSRRELNLMGPFNVTPAPALG